jgi:hypothetical protein
MAAHAICYPDKIAATSPTERFSILGDGTVTDLNTGLMWKKCSGQTGNGCIGTAASYNWQQALKRAETVNKNGGFAGYTDWHVANIKELRSIVEAQCVGFSINTFVFPNMPSYPHSAFGKQAWYWSSSPSVSNGAARFIQFADGSDGITTTNNNGAFSGSFIGGFVRLVRDAK